MDFIEYLPDEMIQHIYSFLPDKYFNELNQRRQAIKRAIGTYYPYGKRNTIYDLETSGGNYQFEKLLLRYFRLNVKMWEYASDHHCYRCLRDHKESKNLIYCHQCGHGQCRRNYRNRNKKHGISGIKKGLLVKKPIYTCPYCAYHNPNPDCRNKNEILEDVFL